MSYKEVEQDIARSETKEDIMVSLEPILFDLTDWTEDLTYGDIARRLEEHARLLHLADAKFKEINRL